MSSQRVLRMHGRSVLMGQRDQHWRRLLLRTALALLGSVALGAPTAADVLLTGAGATFPISALCAVVSTVCDGGRERAL